MKVKELIKRLEALGWVRVRTHGSHHIFKHPKGNRTVPVAVHGKEISDFIAKSILKQAVNALKEK